MLRIVGLVFLLARPGVWLLIGTAFLAGIAVERSRAQNRCLAGSGTFADGLCVGVETAR
ncbi:MAG: hypothetical protein AAF871_00645 [Pseudomonadota bacterium]